jgi:hypothetical protein
MRPVVLLVAYGSSSVASWKGGGKSIHWCAF